MWLALRSLIVLALLGFASMSFAQEFVPLTSITQIFPNLGMQQGIGGFLNGIFQFGIGIAALLAVIMIIWGGFDYMTTDLLPKKESGKERIKGAIYGLLLILGTYIILYTINPAIVNFDLFGPGAGLTSPVTPQGGAPGSGVPASSQNQQFFNNLNQTTCTRIQTYENESGEPETSVETLVYSTSGECERSCPVTGQTTYCTSGGF